MTTATAQHESGSHASRGWISRLKALLLWTSGDPWIEWSECSQQRDAHNDWNCRAAIERIIDNTTNASALTVFLCPDAFRIATDAERSVAWPSSQMTRRDSRYCSADSRSFTVIGFLRLERSRFHWHTNRSPCCSAFVYSLMALIIESSSFLRVSVSAFRLCRRLFISSSIVDWNFVSPQALPTERCSNAMTRQVTDLRSRTVHSLCAADLPLCIQKQIFRGEGMGERFTFERIRLRFSAERD